MTAYTVLEKLHPGDRIKERDFYKLVIEFREAYLADKKYHQRIAQHRVPNEVRQQTIHEVCDYMLLMQRRQEFYVSEGGVGHYIQVKVSDIWKADRRIKSLYEAIGVYCWEREADFNTIAAQVAEYRAMQRVLVKVRRDVAASQKLKNSVPKQIVLNQNNHIIDPVPFLPSLADVKCGDQVTSFIGNLLAGIQLLQATGINAECIRNIIDNRPGKESSFRYFFKTFLDGRYPNAKLSAEEEQGNGRIDLKIVEPTIGTVIIEFKGWWNQDKKGTPEQLCSYMTDFAKTGFVFMINDCLHKDVSDDYKSLITDPSMNYIPDSWQTHVVPKSDYRYYSSRHKFALKEKELYHFIFDVHYTNQPAKRKK